MKIYVSKTTATLILLFLALCTGVNAASAADYFARNLKYNAFLHLIVATLTWAATVYTALLFIHNLKRQ